MVRKEEDSLSREFLKVHFVKIGVQFVSALVKYAHTIEMTVDRNQSERDEMTKPEQRSTLNLSQSIRIYETLAFS